MKSSNWSTVELKTQTLKSYLSVSWDGSKILRKQLSYWIATMIHMTGKAMTWQSPLFAKLGKILQSITW